MMRRNGEGMVKMKSTGASERMKFYSTFSFFFFWFQFCVNAVLCLIMFMKVSLKENGLGLMSYRFTNFLCCLNFPWR